MKTVHKLSFAKNYFGFPHVVAVRLKWIWTSIWQHSSPGWFCGIPRVYWRRKRVRKERGRAEKIRSSFVPVEALRGKIGLYIPWRPFLPLPNYFIVELEFGSVISAIWPSELFCNLLVSTLFLLHWMLPWTLFNVSTVLILAVSRQFEKFNPWKCGFTSYFIWNT